LLVAAAMKGDVTAIGNLADVLDELSQLAEQGNRRAQAALGEMYEHGLVVDKDPARARFWLGKARP
jgi:TPR repeat protein